MLSKLKKIFFKALIFLFLAELLCQAWAQYDGWKKYKELLGQTEIYRDQTYSISKPKNTKRIVIVGGSAVYDTVDDYKKSWPYLLEQKLDQVYDEEIEVINMGFYTENSSDELFKLANFATKLSPDLVIVFDGFNDVYNIFHHYDYWKRLYEVKAKHILNKKKHHFLTELRGWFKKNSALYQRFSQLRKVFIRKISLYVFGKKKEKNAEKINQKNNQSDPSGSSSTTIVKDDPFADVKPGPDGDTFFESRERWPEIKGDYEHIYLTNLTKMAALIHELKAQGLFIFQPDLSYKPLISEHVSKAERDEYLIVLGKHEKIWHEILTYAYPKGLEIMSQIAKKNQFPFYDFNQEIILKEDSADLFDGNVHFSDQGRNRISEAVFKRIQENKLL